MGQVLIDLGNLDSADVAISEATLKGGLFAVENLTFALQLAQTGMVAGRLLPFNKKAMRLAHKGLQNFLLRFGSNIFWREGRAKLQ